MKEQDAIPKYDRGSRIKYMDQHGRVQSGTVRSITAKWTGYMQCGDDPLIFYRVDHPTYSNRETAISGDRILEGVEE